MKGLLLVLLSALFSVNALAQSDENTLSLVSYWSVNDSYDFKITKLKQQWKGDNLVKDEKQEYIANFTVIDSTSSSYTIKWSYKSSSVGPIDLPQELAAKLSGYKDIDVIYQTSEVGDFIGILNWEEISEMMNKVFNDVIEVTGIEDRKQAAAFEAAMKPARKIFSSEEGIEQLIFNELQLMHSFMGIEIQTDEPILYEDELPNMLGGRPIKAQAKIHFEEIDYDSNFCVIKQELYIDPEETQLLLKQAFKQMNLKNKSAKKLLKEAVFEINDNNTYEYFYYPCVPSKVHTIRESIIDYGKESTRRKQQTIIELISDEQEN
jgi:hypothetical protein